MKRLLGTVLAIFLVIVLFFVLLPVLILPALVQGEKGVEVPRVAVLEINLGQTLTDQPSKTLMTRTKGPEGLGPASSIVSIVETLARAEGDAAVSGLLLTFAPDARVSVAQAEEIRSALQSFRSRGKFVIATAPTFRPGNPGAYFTASEADEVWLEADGQFAVAKVETSSLLSPDAATGDGDLKRGKESGGRFAASLDPVHAFAGYGLPQPGGQIYTSMLETIQRRMVSGIALSRGIATGEVEALLVRGVFSANEAMNAGLVSHQGDANKARNSALKRAGARAQTITGSDYFQSRGPVDREGTVIALIYAQGTIGSRSAGSDGPTGISGLETAMAIRAAADDEAVRAVLFRIDSAGGSPVASDQIWHAVKYAQGKGKPVVVSMGSVAASGGYYIAMAADRIIALPTTLTGSIGMVDGKFQLGGSFGSLGLTLSDTLAGAPEVVGGSADAADADAVPWVAVNQVLGTFYTDFTLKVAEGRGMSLEAVNEVASGRVWSGEQAKRLGLIDDIGGFRHAVNETRQLIGLNPAAPVELRVWPGPAGPWERMTQLMGVSFSAGKIVLMFSQLGQVETIKDVMGSVYNGSQPVGIAPESSLTEDKDSAAPQESLDFQPPIL